MNAQFRPIISSIGQGPKGAKPPPPPPPPRVPKSRQGVPIACDACRIKKVAVRRHSRSHLLDLRIRAVLALRVELTCSFSAMEKGRHVLDAPVPAQNVSIDFRKPNSSRICKNTTRN